MGGTEKPESRELTQKNMKTIYIRTIAIGLLTIVYNNLWAQEAIRTITYDFRARTLVLPDTLYKIKKGHFYQVKINNINTNLYTISIDAKDSMIDSNVGFPTLEGIGIDALLKSFEASTTLFTSAVGLISESKKSVGDEKWNEALLSLNETKSFPNMKLTEQQKKEIAEIHLIDSTMDSFAKEMNGFRTYFVLSCMDLVKLKCSINQKLNNALVADSNNRVINLPSSNDLMIQGDNYLDYMNSEISQLAEKYKNYVAFSVNEEQIQTDTILSKRDQKLKSHAETLIENALVMYDSVSATLNQWNKDLISVENNNSYTYLSMPIQLGGDIENLSIKIEPRAGTVNLYPSIIPLKFPLYKKTYLGIGTSFYASTLYNQAYSVKAEGTDSVTNYRIIDELSPKYEIGIAALLHYGERFKGNNKIGYHFTMGPAIGISNKIKPRLSFGAGIAFGEKQMFTIDLMGISGFVERRSAVYNFDERYSQSPEQITVSKLAFGGAIAIGYVYKF
jgi:hypothetical protein